MFQFLFACTASSNKNHSNCDTGELQLNNETGRLEVCINNQWGGVCHENWTSNETLVAYKKLSMNCPSEGWDIYIHKFMLFFSYNCSCQSKVIAKRI